MTRANPLPATTLAGAGVALDIGTTTLAASLKDLSIGKILGRLSAENPQRQWGADVVSRINAAIDGPDALKKMSGALIEACDGLAHTLSKESGLCVTEIAVAGNTVMEHFLLGISPSGLAKTPYKPVFKAAKRLLNAQTLGFKAAPGASLYAFPIIGGFVGGDAVSAALCLGLPKAKRPELAIDIGTNSEIMLSVGGRIYAASAAAGPAFEAGGIKHGMTAEPGAIRAVRITPDGGVKLDVIGGVKPRGICGSGLVEAVSGLIKAGAVERSGRIKGPAEISTNLAVRVKPGKDGNSVALYKDAAMEISLSQQDVRSLQVAKAAIRAGISVLLKKAGIKAEDVAVLHIAGAFGANLEALSLKTIGLIDEAWAGRVNFSGDAALEGAALALGSEANKAEAERIALTAKYVSLSGSAHFEKEFIGMMNF